jgi:rubrerythrin
MKAVEKVLLTAIEIERYGQEYYSYFARSISDRNGKALLRGLADDEKDHEELLSKEYKAMTGRLPPAVVDIDIGEESVKSVFAHEREKGKADLTIRILKLGIAVEKKSIDFYSSKGEVVKSARLKKLLAYLVEIEKGHKAILEENLAHLKHESAWWGYVPILDG